MTKTTVGGRTWKTTSTRIVATARATVTTTAIRAGSESTPRTGIPFVGEAVEWLIAVAC